MYPEIQKQYNESLPPNPVVSPESDLDYAAARHAKAYINYRQLSKLQAHNENRFQRSSTDIFLREVVTIGRKQLLGAHEKLIIATLAFREAIRNCPAPYNKTYGYWKMDGPHDFLDCIQWGLFNTLIK